MDEQDISVMLATIKEYIFQRKGVLVEISAPTTPSQVHMVLSAFATANRYLNEQKQKESSPQGPQQGNETNGQQGPSGGDA